ncbi:M4 family metallopeptidase [Pyxidicoccus parkwayensis]|uniref:M4 family metallopeptidase n=1 Tax=Pyxidicoccus parkwayensis TaxID=2813578 RepID=A0ABX7PC92_9BACT|nr:M4 family metallopeptidase [Pyxidicoccus parkwaysis]
MKAFCVVWLGAGIAACSPLPEEAVHDSGSAKNDAVKSALARFEGVQVLGVQDDVPSFIRGNFGRVPQVSAQRARDAGEDVRAVLRDLAPVFRLNDSDLVFRKQSVDEQGHRHLRFRQLHQGLPVIGGELVLHVDPEGRVYAANSSARGGTAVSVEVKVAPEVAAKVAVSGSRAEQALVDGPAERVFLRPEGDEALHLAWQVRVKGERDGMPSDDLVYVDAKDGVLLAVHPRIHSGLNRRMYDARNTTTLPGTELMPPYADPVVATNYSHLGTVYNCYNSLFGRDSINNAGAQLISTVHYSRNYVNAFWNGTQMVYGDGDGVNASNLANSLDVTAHELTHAVTEYESDLIYSGESGGLNESLSDIFGAVCEWYGDGQGPILPRYWIVGDDVWTPNIPNDGLRYMNNPTQDGDSLDYYPDYSSGVDVHYSSGISNLAFYLLSQGGTHPRGKTSTVVAGIGIEKAARIFYKANVDILLPSSNFEAAKLATEQTAFQLGYDAATIQSVTNAWLAVGVGIAVPPPGPLPLQNDVPVKGLESPTGETKHYFFDVPAAGACGQPMVGNLTFSISGGTGDADLYVKSGSPPTTSSYDCRPYLSGNNETCTFNNPPPGSRWYVMLRPYAPYFGVELKVTYTRTDTRSGSVAVGQEVQYGPYCALTGTKLKVLMTGAGDPDLYVRWSAPPNVNAYDCRPYVSGAAETCELTYPPVVSQAYLMVRGFTAGTYALTITQTPP